MNASRSLLNTIVQSSTVELFHSSGIAIAPLPPVRAEPGKPKHFDPAGVITFSAPQLKGKLALSLADAVYSLFTPPVVGVAVVRDSLSELTNQLIGRVKNRLLQFQVTPHVGLPSILSGSALERQKPASADEMLYAFRTLRGEVRVTVDAAVDESALKYSNGVNVLREGDFVLF